MGQSRLCPVGPRFCPIGPRPCRLCSRFGRLWSRQRCESDPIPFARASPESRRRSHPACCPTCSRLARFPAVRWTDCPGRQRPCPAARLIRRSIGPICPRLDGFIAHPAVQLVSRMLAFAGWRAWAVPFARASWPWRGGIGAPSLCPECPRFVVPPAIRGEPDQSGDVGKGGSGPTAGIRDTSAANSYTRAAKWDTGLGLQSSPPVASVRHELLSWPVARRDEA